MDCISSRASPNITVKVEDLLRFFDERPPWSEKHATAVVGVAGEDLNAACFRHFVDSKGGVAAVLTDSESGKPLRVTTGRKGPWLDRWIRVNWNDGSASVFQTEIKNWSAHSIHGKTLAVPATPDQLADYKESRWNQHWDEKRQCLRQSHTSKVLSRMKLPDVVDEGEEVRPLLIFWEALGPRDRADEHLFSVGVNGEFSELWVFSVSSYLRSVLDAGNGTLQLEMPEAAHRIALLDRFFPM